MIACVWDERYIIGYNDLTATTVSLSVLVYSMQHVAARRAGLSHIAQLRSADKLQCFHHQSGQYTGEQHQCQRQSPSPPDIARHPLEGTQNILTNLYLDSRDDKCYIINMTFFSIFWTIRK
jgi:hypothetical protein